jgi:hypothetical protein
VSDTTFNHLFLKFGHFLSVHRDLRELQPPSALIEIYQGQMETLRSIKDDDGKDVKVYSQVSFFSTQSCYYSGR